MSEPLRQSGSPKANHLLKLSELGQSVWLDLIRRDLFQSGQFARWIADAGLRGMTSNPAIFEKAIGHSPLYDGAIAELLSRGDRDARALYESLAIQDIQSAADVLRGVHGSTQGRDGYVSLEVSPELARDTQGSIAEARRLWAAVGRPNVMIKIPATEEGVPAIRQLLSEGIPVNVTLLFSRARYEQVAYAFLDGAEAWLASGGRPDQVASVASFFVSRIDTLVDTLLDDRLRLAPECEVPGREGPVDPAVRSVCALGTLSERMARLRGLKGKAAVANAKVAYAKFREILASPRWHRLAAQGVRPQRVLWASTGVKNPAYRDTMYVEELIGPDTVTTLPQATLEAFRDHGVARATALEGLDEARATLEQLESLQISIGAVTDLLLDQAVQLFSEPFEKLLTTLERKRAEGLGSRLNGGSEELPSELLTVLESRLKDAAASRLGRRIWLRERSPWAANGIAPGNADAEENTEAASDPARWLGWLDLPDPGGQRELLDRIRAFVAETRAEGVTDVLLIGMGGSSLAPELFGQYFAGGASGRPTLHVLDTTDPARISEVERAADLGRALFIVSSKSGSTLEPNLLYRYFRAKLQEPARPGAGPRFQGEALGRRFVAITDPGSSLDQLALRDGFRAIFPGVPSVGGRYSALSAFGLVPLALIGGDPVAFLERARAMRLSCSESVPPAVNPGVRLGVGLGVLARHGRDKVTFLSTPRLSGLQLWLEQLLAESTGKHGKGLIPIAHEPEGVPECYGADRVFVYLRLDGDRDPMAEPGRISRLEERVEALAHSGQPVFRIDVRDSRNLGQELFRWEMATAVAGSILGINPFDQPDVEAAKVAARRLTARFEETGRIEHGDERLLSRLDVRPHESDRNGGSASVSLFDAAPGTLPEALQGSGPRLVGVDDPDVEVNDFAEKLSGFFRQLGPSGYFGLLAYLPPSATCRKELEKLRIRVRNHLRVATTMQFGPRNLHSVGQAFKGGPKNGCFLVVTCDDAGDLERDLFILPGPPVPPEGGASDPGKPGRLSFGAVKFAQALGDLQILRERGQKALRLHIEGDLALALSGLQPVFRRALDPVHPLNNQVNTEGVNREFGRLNSARRVKGSQ